MNNLFHNINGKERRIRLLEAKDNFPLLVNIAFKSQAETPINKVIKYQCNQSNLLYQATAMEERSHFNYTGVVMQGGGWDTSPNVRYPISACKQKMHPIRSKVL